MRVLATMSELNYRMNNAARALGTRRSRTLGVLVSDAFQYGPSRSITAVEASARESGYWVSAVFTDPGDTNAVGSSVSHLVEQGVEGIVAIAPHARTLDALNAADVAVPFVTLHSSDRDARGLWADQVAGARLAVAALADVGHTRIAHLAGPGDWLEADSRAEGFTKELADRGIDSGLILSGDWSAASGYASTDAILAAGVTAVFAANDQMALGLMGGLHEAGLSVPSNVSVVGFDDIPDSAYYWPPLTTVRQDFDELARRAVAILIGRSSEADLQPLTPALVLRSSISTPPST